MPRCIVTYSFVLFLFCSAGLSAQETTRIQLLGADVIEYDEDIVRAQRLIGKVSFAHENVRMYCDSAWLYEQKNDLRAFGKVRIVEQGGVNLRADSLFYDGNARKAWLYDNITLRDEEMTLTTDRLTYNTEERVGSYFGGGRIVSTVNRHVLTSDIGTYFAEGKVFHFKKDVVMDDPQYEIYTDTLHYHSYSEQSYFLGPTEIVSDQDMIYCENGWYDSKNDIAQFEENSYIWSNGQQLLGDSLYYNRNAALGEAFENVALIDTTNDISIFGRYGRYLEDIDLGLVTDSALMVQYFEDDTLYLHADTLIAAPDTLDNRLIRAYYNVGIFKTDMQGSCDSLTYSESDSLIVMYREPLLWSEENQISGELITLLTYDGKIERMNTYNDAFIISEVDSSHYNQMKGKDLIGYFKDNQLSQVLIQGNGQAIYFAEEEKDSMMQIIGVNMSKCSSILIHIIDRQIERVNFMAQPESSFYPMDKISADELILPEFIWYANRRPNSLEALFHEADVPSQE